MENDGSPTRKIPDGGKMVEQTGFEFEQHRQPPPVVPIRDGLGQQPQPARPAPMPTAQQTTRLLTEPIQNIQPQYVQLARAVSQILATRILLLIAVITASAVWGYTIYDPLQLRIIAASAFSVLGVMPLIILYARKG